MRRKCGDFCNHYESLLTTRHILTKIQVPNRFRRWSYRPEMKGLSDLTGSIVPGRQCTYKDTMCQKDRRIRELRRSVAALFDFLHLE